MTLAKTAAATTGALLLFASTASAQLSPYSQDFESLDIMDGSALDADGWLVFANVFDGGFGFLYNYGPFPAPNGTPGFSSVATGDGGPAQMAQYLNAYSDYNNGDHGVGNIINALVFREQVPDAGNIGQTWRFTFDYRKNPNVVNGDGATTTAAYIRVIKVSDSSFATLFEATFDTTNVPDTLWATNALEIPIDAAFVGEVVQIGFQSFATNFDDSGRFYDNIAWGAVSNPGLGDIACIGNAMSTGAPAELAVRGSDVATDNNITLEVTGLPFFAPGYFITSQASGFLYNPGGSVGNICIDGAPIGRYSNFVQFSGTTGAVSFSPDLTMVPAATMTISVMAGDTQFFQYWTRDSLMGTAVSNFSGAVGVTFN
ncbi:MAG: hypothetical protein AAF726_12440 [Planctomycetota bacterium]